LLFLTAAAASAATPRILYVGDSWTYYPWAEQSPPALRSVLARPEIGLGAFEEVGDLALASPTAEGWNTPDLLGRITQKLNEFPTIDIVHISLGGNDLNLRYRWSTSEAEKEALLNEVREHIRGVVEHCLNVRPNVKVAIVGYDYLNATEGFDFNQFGIVQGWENPTALLYAIYGIPLPLTVIDVANNQQRLNDVFIGLEQRKKDLALGMDRVVYVHNFGLMQATFGIDGLGIPPLTIPLPDPPPNYSNFPGGNADLYSPREAMAGSSELDPIHLSPQGYIHLMESAVAQAYLAWLSDSAAPQVVSIGLPAGAVNPTDAASVAFVVTFTENVTGVDVSDFVAVGDGGITSAEITGVSGGGSVYTVTVGNITGSGSLSVDLIDNDSIYDRNWYPLANLADGTFTSGAAYTISGSAPCTIGTEFEAQGSGLYTAVGLNWTADDLDSNGIADGFEAALLGSVLCDTMHSLHAVATSTYASNAQMLPAPGSVWYTSYNNALAGLASVSSGLSTFLGNALGLAGFMPVSSGGAEPFSANGDVDGDGASNGYEYEWTIANGGGLAEYIANANNAASVPGDTLGCLESADFAQVGTDFYAIFGIDWNTVDVDGNGVPDGQQAADFGAILCDSGNPVSGAANAAYEANLSALAQETNSAWLVYFDSPLAALMASNAGYANVIIQVFGLTGSYSSI
jgi:hypothetical protein